MKYLETTLDFIPFVETDEDNFRGNSLSYCKKKKERGGDDQEEKENNYSVFSRIWMIS